jgi:hypothetical protein
MANPGLLQDAAIHPQLHIVPFERRNAADLPYDLFLKEYLAKNRPVIIENAVPQWAALRDWTPEFFRSSFGDREVEVTYGVHMKLGELIDAVLASTMEKPGPYLHKVIIHQHMPELLPYLSPENEYGFPRRLCSTLMPKRFHRPDGFLKLLIGGVGGKFPLMHYDSDNSNAVITEIYGDKEFVLFSPEDTPYVYPHENSKQTAQVDDLDHPDLTRFPDFIKATQYRGIIGPGEAMFVPSGWWHAARVVTTSISVCTNMIDGSNWDGFIREACETNGTGGLNNSVKKLYLKLAGTAMSTAETIQKIAPATASLGLASISPVAASGRRIDGVS